MCLVCLLGSQDLQSLRTRAKPQIRDAEDGSSYRGTVLLCQVRAGLPAIPGSRHWRGKGDSTH